MAKKDDPTRTPDLKAERDEMENNGAANPQEVAEAEREEETTVRQPHGTR